MIGLLRVLVSDGRSNRGPQARCVVYRRGIELRFNPVKPIDNATSRSFNGKCRVASALIRQVLVVAFSSSTAAIF